MGVIEWGAGGGVVRGGTPAETDHPQETLPKNTQKYVKLKCYLTPAKGCYIIWRYENSTFCIGLLRNGLPRV